MSLTRNPTKTNSRVLTTPQRKRKGETDSLTLLSSVLSGSSRPPVLSRNIYRKGSDGGGLDEYRQRTLCVGNELYQRVESCPQTVKSCHPETTNTRDEDRGRGSVERSKSVLPTRVRYSQKSLSRPQFPREGDLVSPPLPVSSEGSERRTEVRDGIRRQKSRHTSFYYQGCRTPSTFLTYSITGIQ